MGRVLQLTLEQVDDILRARTSSNVDAFLSLVHKAQPRFMLKDIPSSKALLAKTVADSMSGMEILFLFTDWGVYPVSQVPGFVERVRSSVGITAPIVTARGELIPPDQGVYLLHLLAATLYSYDGCVLYDLKSQRGWYLSHDEYIAPLYRNQSDLDAAIISLGRVGVTEIDRRKL